MQQTRSGATRTYRGGSLEELLPQILSELGPEAVITKQREGVVGGVGGFFGKRCVEVEVELPLPQQFTPTPTLPRRAVVDAYDRGDTLVGQPAVGQPAVGQPSAARPVAEPAFAPGDTGSPIIDAMFAQALPFADHLTAAAAAVSAATASSTLRSPEPWDEFDLAELDDEEFQPLDLAPDPLSEQEQAREWAKQEIRAMKAGIAQRHCTAAATVAPLRTAAPARGTARLAPVASATAAPATAVRSVTTRPATAPAVPRALAAALTSGPAAEPGRLPAQRTSTEIVAVSEALSEAGLPESLVLAIHKDVSREVRPFANDLPVRAQVRAVLARRIKTKSGWRGKRRTIALVGTYGSGKSLTAAKLCHAFAVGGGLSVGVVSLESPRSAIQLGLLTEGIGVDFQIADAPSQVALAVGRVDARDVIVVDTPGADADDAESIDRLERLLAALRPDETHFLVPASADVQPSQALLAALAGRIGVDRILITRLDEAPALGAQIALSISSRLPISYLASGGEADFGLAPADPVVLAGMVLP